MSIQFVESLVVVDVDKQEGQGPPACIRSLKGVPKVSVQMSSVADTREWGGEGLCAYGREIGLEPGYILLRLFQRRPEIEVFFLRLARRRKHGVDALAQRHAVQGNPSISLAPRRLCLVSDSKPAAASTMAATCCTSSLSFPPISSNRSARRLSGKWRALNRARSRAVSARRVRSKERIAAVNAGLEPSK